MYLGGLFYSINIVERQMLHPINKKEFKTSPAGKEQHICNSLEANKAEIKDRS